MGILKLGFNYNYSEVTKNNPIEHGPLGQIECDTRRTVKCNKCNSACSVTTIKYGSIIVNEIPCIGLIPDQTGTMRETPFTPENLIGLRLMSHNCTVQKNQTIEGSDFELVLIERLRSCCKKTSPYI